MLMMSRSPQVSRCQCHAPVSGDSGSGHCNNVVTVIIDFESIFFIATTNMYRSSCDHHHKINLHKYFRTSSLTEYCFLGFSSALISPLLFEPCFLKTATIWSLMLRTVCRTDSLRLGTFNVTLPLFGLYWSSLDKQVWKHFQLIINKSFPTENKDQKTNTHVQKIFVNALPIDYLCEAPP